MSSSKNMPYVRLGNSGLKVSRIILGTMQYGDKTWQSWLLDEDEAVVHIQAAYEAGIQTFDTADTYSNGRSEIILGKAIKQLNLPREKIVVMTKCFAIVCEDVDSMDASVNVDESRHVNQHGLSRKHIFAAVKGSLERLQLDYIDVLHCHRFDPDTPIEETMQALHDVVQVGYVRYIGMSSCWAYQFHAMQNYAITHKLTPFISMQNHYNLLYREEEREMFPTLKMFGVGAIPWSPLARGMLTRPMDQQSGRAQSDPWFNMYRSTPAYEKIVQHVGELAQKKGVSMAQIAVAWILSKDGVTAPIVGTTNLVNLRDIIAGVHLKLTPEELKYLEEEYKPTQALGHQ